MTRNTHTRPPPRHPRPRRNHAGTGARHLDRCAAAERDEPFGAGPEAVARAVAHLGYVQIDTINVIERCHHHILYNRIPAYGRADLEAAQAEAKSVFEYWTHALSYVPSTTSVSLPAR